MKVGLYVGEARNLDRCLEEIVEAERRGLCGVWLPGTLGIDSLTALAVAAGRTERIRLGAGIAYAWPRHPVVQQALTIAAACDGRFELGIGTGHRPMIEQTFGLPCERPVGRMLEYGLLLHDLIEHGSASLEGRHYRVEATLWLEQRPAVPIVVGTLREQMTRAAGRFADGIMTWLAPARYLGSVVVAAAQAGADRARRPAPRIVAAVPATLSTDRQAALDGLNAAFGMMARAPSYLAMLERAGLTQPVSESGWTEEMLDVVVAWGDEAALQERARELFDAGADEVVFWPFPVGDAPASVDATRRVLGELAAR